MYMHVYMMLVVNCVFYAFDRLCISHRISSCEHVTHRRTRGIHKQHSKHDRIKASISLRTVQKVTENKYKQVQKVTENKYKQVQKVTETSTNTNQPDSVWEQINEFLRQAEIDPEKRAERDRINAKMRRFSKRHDIVKEGNLGIKIMSGLEYPEIANMTDEQQVKFLWGNLSMEGANRCLEALKEGVCLCLCCIVLVCGFVCACKLVWCESDWDT